MKNIKEFSKEEMLEFAERIKSLLKD